MRKRQNELGLIVKIKGSRKPYRAVVTSVYTVDGNENKKQIRKLLGYLPNNAYSMCDILYSKYMVDITVFDLQNVIDECEKNYPN